MRLRKLLIGNWKKDVNKLVKEELKPKIDKLDFEKQNVIIKETYIDENGHEQERKRCVQMTKFPPKEEKVDLILKTDPRLKDEKHG